MFEPAPRGVARIEVTALPPSFKKDPIKADVHFVPEAAG